MRKYKSSKLKNEIITKKFDVGSLTRLRSLLGYFRFCIRNEKQYCGVPSD